MTATRRPDHPAPLLSASVIDCRTGRMSAHAYAGLTVITIAGDIDAANVKDLTRRARAVVPAGSALILDLATVDFIGVDGLRALLSVNIECARCNTSWVLIASHAVTRLLRVGDRDGTLPVVGSAVEALLRLRRRARGGRHLDSQSAGA